MRLQPILAALQDGADANCFADTGHSCSASLASNSMIRERANRVQALSFAKAAKFEPVPHLRTAAFGPVNFASSRESAPYVFM